MLNTSTVPSQIVWPRKTSLTGTDSMCVESHLCNWRIAMCNRSMYSLFATALHKVCNGPDALFDTCGHCWSATDREMDFAKIVVCKMKGDGSFKVLPLFAECIREP